MAFSILRWTARSSAVALALLFLAFMASEIFVLHSGRGPAGAEWLLIALLSTACLSPLLTWRWEMPAAVVSLACLAGFIVFGFRDIGPVQLLVFAVIAVPGLLFLADWALAIRVRLANSRVD